MPKIVDSRVIYIYKETLGRKGRDVTPFTIKKNAQCKEYIKSSHQGPDMHRSKHLDA